MLSAVSMLPPAGLGFAAPISAIKPSPVLGASITMAAGAPEAEAPPPPFHPETFAKTLPGITGPLGFFDPLGYCSAGGDDERTEGKIRFYREVEVKHARVAMLAALGFPLGEQFHPLFGGDIDVPSHVAFQQTPLQTFWPAVVIAIAIPEVFSVSTFEDPARDDFWTIRKGHKSGDFGFDPLGLKPKDPEEFKEMQTV